MEEVGRLEILCNDPRRDSRLGVSPTHNEMGKVGVSVLGGAQNEKNNEVARLQGNKWHRAL